jgi:hypothetical protein
VVGADTKASDMGTWVYFAVLAAGFCIQYACDVRNIGDVAKASHWSVGSIRWSPFAGWLSASERCYHVRVRDLHGRVEMRLCRVKGVIGLPVDVAFDARVTARS